jgi:hypothetical protein
VFVGPFDLETRTLKKCAHIQEAYRNGSG